MILRTLEHVSFEGPAAIADWARERGIDVERTAIYAGKSAPDVDSFDILAVMGGPMNIYEEDKYPWLAAEKRLIKEAIDAGKIVIGVCLGAQLIADCLGAKITPNEYKEIGWLPITLAEGELLAFHWHGDTFSLPAGSERLASSVACLNQGFTFGKNVLALQFHIEYSPESIETMIKNCPEDFADGGRYVQTVEQMREQIESRTADCNTALSRMLDRFINA